MFELRPRPGFQPVLMNPKPSTPVRPLELTAMGWKFGPDRYGHEQGIVAFEVQDPDQAIRQLEDVARSSRDVSLVYYVTRGRKPSVGAVALGTKLPLGWEPVPASRPYPQ